MTSVCEIQNKYLVKLSDLKINSKPVITMLSILAADNIKRGDIIVGAIEKHITQISPEEKLPALYLIDSIVKNVGGEYLTLFSRVIVNIFCGVFKDVNVDVRQKIFRLRQTWNDIFPITKLYALDVNTNGIDPGWPITAKIAPAIQGRQQQVELLKFEKRKLELEIAGIVQQLISPTPTLVESSISVMSTSPAEPALKKRKLDKIGRSIENKENVDLPTQLSQGMTHPVIDSQLSQSNEKSNWATVKANPPKSNNWNLDSSRPISVETNLDLQKSRDIDGIWDLANSLKPRHQTNIDALYSGMSCSNCSIRFPPEQTIKYSQHLDWHFRENRRNRDMARQANSRGWYYNVADWIQYEKIEDVSERQKSWFEIQKSEMDLANDDSAQWNESQAPSCIAGPDDVAKTCDMCHEQFETFFNDDDEEWHLRNALRMDKKAFHPICFKDYNKSSLTLDECNVECDFDDVNANKFSMQVQPDVADAVRVDRKTFDPICIAEYNESTLMLDIKCDVDEDKLSMELESDATAEVAPDDEDDDVILLKPEEPVIIEILDDDETPISSVSTSDIVEHVDSMSSTVKPFKKESNETYESIGNELDVQILVPQISVVMKLEESLQMSVKIKEEPKDDELENIGTFKDAETLEDIETFEDIDTLEEATVHVNVDDITQSHQKATSDHPTQVSVINNLDGNVQWQPAPTKIGVNNIKINLKSNVLVNVIKSNQNVGKQPPKVSFEKCQMPRVNVEADETSALCSIM